jgi:hypothetical protein
VNNPNAPLVLNVELRTRRCSLRVHALVRVAAYEISAEDDQREPRISASLRLPFHHCDTVAGARMRDVRAF